MELREPDKKEVDIRAPGKASQGFTFTLRHGFWRVFSKWALGFLLTTALGFLLLSVDAAQLTAPGAAHKALRRTVASLTEIDALLATKSDMVTTSGQSATSAGDFLAGFPIDIPLSQQEVQNLSTPELRDVILDRSADRLYAEGFSAFHDSTQSSADVQMLSPPGAVRYTAGFLTSSNHDVARIVMFGLAGLAAILTLGVVLLSRGYGRLTSVGAAVLAASIPILVLSVAVRFILRLASDQESDYLTAQLYALGRDVAWLPVRNAIAFTCLGLVFVTLGIAFSLLSKRQTAAS
jgi:hypothetical protein